MTTVRLSDLKNALNAVDYPAGKDDLVRHAEQAAAGDEVQRAVRSLPPVDYGSFDEVARSVHPDLGTGQTAAQHSAPQRRPPQPGVAEDLR